MRILAGIEDNLIEDDAYVLGINLYYQLLVGVLCRVLYTWRLVHFPRGFANHVEGLGKICQLWFDLNHLGIETRQEKNIVDQLQQYA